MKDEPGPKLKSGDDPSAGSSEPAHSPGRSSAAKFRVAVTGDFEGLATEIVRWNDLGEDTEVVTFTELFDSPEQTVEALRDFDAITLMRERIPLTREILEQLPRLKFIIFSGNANETLDVAAAAERNIIVCNSTPDLDIPRGSPGGKSPSELTMALLLGCTWQTGAATDLLRRGGWAFHPGIPLRGKTLGIIGYGDIGKSVARVALALGMNVAAFSRSLTNEVARAEGISRSSLDDLLKTSDVISIHLRLTPKTRGLIGAREIAAMKDGVIFINTARAQIVMEEPFIDALRTRKIGMAGLDVFWEEPLPPDHPLTKLPNVVMTPHIGYSTEVAMAVRYQEILHTLVEYRNGNIIGRYVPKPFA